MFILILIIMSIVVAVLYGNPIFDVSECVLPPVALGGLLAGAASGVGSMLSSLFGGLFSSSSQNKQFEQQKELMKYNQELGFENMEKQQSLAHQTFDYTFSKEAGLNSQLMASSPAIQKSAMLNAGINPASQFGTFSGNLAQASAPTYTPQGGSPSAPNHLPVDFSPIANLGAQVGNVLSSIASARKQNADAEGQEIKNQEKKEENQVYEALNNFFEWKLENGNLVYEPADMSQGLPSVLRTNLKTKVGVRAIQLASMEILRDKADMINNISQSQLQQKIAEGRLSNNRIFSAMVAMPAAEYDKFRQELSSLVKDEKLKQLDIDYNSKRNNFELPEQKLHILEHYIKEHTNIYTSLERFTNGSWNINDLLYCAFALAASSISR